MALWTAADAATATGGTTTTAWQAEGVSIDTRSLRRGDLFIALTDLRDGHDFVAAALQKGAAAALVTHRPADVPEDAPLLIVPDVLQALASLGRFARDRTKARVIGVTGSVGKTSTKEMLRMILSGQGRTHAAEASYNNHWGVPLTLCRMPQDCDFAVIEIGMNHPGEIAPLARLAKLNVAMITTVAPAHLEAFASVEAIAAEKAAVLQGLEPGGIAVLPADLPVSAILLDSAAALEVPVLRFGATPGVEYQMTDSRLCDTTTVIRAQVGGRDVLFKVRSPGRHFAMNGLGALAVAGALGLDPVIAATDLGHWAPPPGRGSRERILLDVVDETAFDLYDDAFNANPASMAAALDVLIAATPEHGVGTLGRGRRIAILGDMLELGATEAALHAAIADHPGLAAVDLIHCVGPRMKVLWQALPRRQRGLWIGSAAALLPQVRGLIDAGDVVLVKGSKGIKVATVVDALRKLGQQPATSAEGDH